MRNLLYVHGNAHMITWPNLSPNIQSFTKTATVPLTPYGAIPTFVQTTGVLPGQQPVVGHVVSPGRVNVRALANNINNVFTVKH